MPTSARTLIVTLVTLLVAVLMAYYVGEGEFALPIVLGVILLVSGAYVAFFQHVRIEALVVGTLLVINIVTQQGLPKISVAGEALPLYPAEIAMILCLVAFGLRVPYTKERFLERYPLSIAIAVFILIGTIRFAFDGHAVDWSLRDLRDIARDYAVVYYAALFFLGVRLFQHQPSRRFIEHLLPFAVALLLPVFALAMIFPQLPSILAIRGVPLVYPRADLTGSFLAFGCLYFLLRREQHERGVASWLTLTGLSLACFALMMVGLSRATFMGFGVGLVLLLIARKSRLVLNIAAFAFLGFIVVVALEEWGGQHNEDRFTKRITDKVSSIVDFGGGANRSYASGAGDASVGNNRFRTIWWQSVWDETMQGAPLTGLGFGYDLAARFLQNYGYDLGEDFSARSPHNVLMTILGRMGLIGFLSILVIVGMIFHSAFRCAWAVRRGQAPALFLAPWCGVITIFVTACFGVMLEGPMAAVVFWLLLALASTREQEFLALHRKAADKGPTRIEPPRPAPQRVSRPPLPAGVGRL